jgi:hypothetical protein
VAARAETLWAGEVFVLSTFFSIPGLLVAAELHVVFC